MKKANILWIIMEIIFLIIFNVIFFTIGGTDHNASVWISYGFIHFSYSMLILTPKLNRWYKSAAVLGLSLYAISTVCFFVQFIVGLLFILMSLSSIKLALVVQLCIAGLYGILLIANIIANEHTAEAEEKRQNENEYVKSASVKLKYLIDSVKDKEVKKKIEKIYDTVYSSPAKSHCSLEQIEMQILNSIDELVNAVLKEDKGNIIVLLNSLLAVVNERNQKLRKLN